MLSVRELCELQSLTLTQADVSLGTNLSLYFSVEWASL